MKNKISTSIEQSKKLLELGFDVNTADMIWIEDYLGYDSDDKRKHGEYRLYGDMLIPAYGQNSVPAWSLSALLELFDNKAGIAKDYETLWFAYDNGKSHCSKHYDNPLDAAFEMVVWLKENGKI